jgi:hypothetical protein
MGAIEETHLPKEIRKELSKSYRSSTALPRFISLRFVEANRAKRILLDPNRDLDAETRAGLESFYLNKLSWAVGASTGFVAGILTAGFGGQAIVSSFGKSAGALVVLAGLTAGYAVYLLVLFGAKKYFAGNHLANLRAKYPIKADSTNL